MLLDVWQRDHGADFAAGVALVTAHAPKAVTQRILVSLQLAASGAGRIDDYLRGKLENALRATPAPDAPVSMPRKSVRLHPPASADEQETPPARRSVPEAIPLHKRHSFAHAMLVAAATDAERASLAIELMEEIVPALDRIYDAHLEGRAPAEPAAPGEVADAATIRRLQSLRTRVSRLRNQLIPGAPTPARKAQLEKELDLKLAEIKQIETLL